MQSQRFIMKVWAPLVTTSVVGLLAAAAAFGISGGTWTKKSFAVEGTWQIVEEGGRGYVVLSDDFKTRKAPDLKIFLSKQSVKGATGKNATTNAVLVGELPRAKGAVRLPIPEGIDVSEYSTILLHCERYSKLWAAAEL